LAIAYIFFGETPKLLNLIDRASRSIFIGFFGETPKLLNLIDRASRSIFGETPNILLKEEMEE